MFYFNLKYKIKNLKFNFFITLFILFLPFLLFSQNNVIRGFVYLKKSGEPVPYISVYLKKTQLGALTNVEGYFAITKIPAGSYSLIVSGIGYDTLKLPVTLKTEDVITKKFYLTESVLQLNVVNISGERQESKTETQVSVTKITPKQIYQIPSMGGQADLAQYLQVLPGVIFTGDQGGQLYICGGSPVENEVLLDGMIIYNPFHSIGLFSVFDTDILQSADIYTGGFGAEYGDRISSVMDIKTRAGNKKRFAGKAEVTTFGSKLLLEGPMKIQKDSSEGNSSFILSAKDSYLSRTSKTFYSYANKEGLPFDYTDLYGKVSFESNNGSQFNIFGFDYADNVTGYQSIADFHWNNTGIGSNFIVIPGKAPVLMEGVFAYSDYNITLSEANNTPMSSEINGFNIGLHFTYFMGNNTLKYGLDLIGINTDLNLQNSVGDAIEETDHSTEFGAYAKYKMTFGKFIIEPSFRAHYYGSVSAFSPEPRLAFKYNLSDKLRLKAAGGLYSQNLISTTYTTDVVNLFYGFVTSPNNIASGFNGQPVTNAIQKAQHAVIGLEYDILNDISLNLEAYYKNFSQVIELNPYQIYSESDPAAIGQSDVFVKNFIYENGYADGIDCTIKYDHKHWYIYAVNSLGSVHLFDGVNSYAPYWDRTYNANLVATFRFGKALGWEAGARWNIGSGFPFTQTQGIYEKLNLSDGINANYTSANGDLAFIFAQYDAARLPWYHRLDLSLKKRFYTGRNSELMVNATVINVYNRKNIFYIDRTTNAIVYQLPIMPTIGASLSF